MTMLVASPQAAENTTVTTSRKAIHQSKTKFRNAPPAKQALQNQNRIHNRR